MLEQERSPNTKAGFTLLEVLVAMALLSIALVSIIQLFSINLRGIATSEDLAKAVMRAEATMRDVLDDEDIAEKSSSETTPDGYRVDVAITKAEEARTENLPLELLQISLTVHWKDGVKERTLTLKTMKAVTKKI
ncbi:MAG TPA: prepilin-type N-terminal cleavage/methylation domain-containing protein [Candidatus Sulfobium mesophilum]|nr:prepilin-type N-terminal cleavage/methylation domain-containing protein [Candidatus Sulfobium mesophilum]